MDDWIFLLIMLRFSDIFQLAITADLAIVNKDLTTNLFDSWLLSQSFIPLMRKNRYGRIMNVSSGSGSLQDMGGGTPAYSISKVALNSLTRMLAAELRGSGILVNSADPGWVATDMGVLEDVRYLKVQKELYGLPLYKIMAQVVDFFMMVNLKPGNFKIDLRFL